MPKLVKGNTATHNDVVVVAKGETAPHAGKVLINIADWQPAYHSRQAGIWLDSDQAPSLVEGDINQFDVIAINFPVFADGRGYSYAHILRNELAYKGELRAIGDVLKDQLFFLKRCGFDAFVIREDRDANDALSSLNDFSQTYQAAVDDKTPLFKKRWG